VERIERQGGGDDSGGGGGSYRPIPNEPAAYDDFGDEPF
jgi:hypothetical protein